MSQTGMMLGALLLLFGILWELHLISRKLETIIDNQTKDEDE